MYHNPNFYFIFTCFLQDAGLKPNVQVFSALIGRATRRLDYVYLKTILKCMSSMKVWPNEVIIRQLEFAAQYPPNYDQVSGCTSPSTPAGVFSWTKHCTLPAQYQTSEGNRKQTQIVFSLSSCYAVNSCIQCVTEKKSFDIPLLWRGRCMSATAS